MTLAPDADAIRTFLTDTVRDNIHLVALREVPGQDADSNGAWFGGNVESAVAWAVAYSLAGWNVYWTVNVVTPGLPKKSSKAEIAHARFVHVDVDPPKGVLTAPWDRAAALARIVGQGATSIWDSGNGWGALWRLNAPCTDQVYVESVNRGCIVAVGGGDASCFNVDRILRLPGTVNYPGKLKQSWGRVPVLSTLHQPDSGLVYDVKNLFPPVAAAAPRESVDIGAYVLLGPDDLAPLPSDRLRELICAPNSGDRSGDAIACAGEMARCGYPNEVILGILMNPANAVHAHIGDQQYQERAALRCVEKAAANSPAAAFGSVAPVLPAGATLTAPPRDPRYRDTSGQYMSAEQQIEHFKGCVWVQDEDKIWIGDEFLNQRQFDKRYGGRKFVIDPVGERPTKSAWEAFTESMVLDMVWTHGTCFRPDLAAGTVLNVEGRTLLNTYVPIETHRVAGDPAPFLDLLTRMLPVEGDRKILLNYMAALVQYPGCKFQWWPVIQGTKGNGKTALSTILQHAVGDRYSHLPNVAKMARNGINFNAWLDRRLFCGLEEVYAANRRDFLEEFKPYITNGRISIEKKGVDETTGDNRCNGIALTNHRDGVPIDDDERRYAVFFTAQQCAEDIVRDGMDGNYFPDFYNWLFGREGYAGHGENYGLAVCNDFLRTYQLCAELNPAGACVRAPRTSTYALAVRASLGSVEQEILEAIEQNEPGFCGGWVSSLYLNRLLERLRIKVARNKRPDILRAMGYIPHPSLPNGGRVNNPINPDGGRPTLYVLRQHAALLIKDQGDVAKAYTAAQHDAMQTATVLAFRRTG